MRIWHAAVASLVLALAFPTAAQIDESLPYFSIATNRTFGPGEKPIIQLWAQGVDHLQFRVYRVHDPVAFFERLDDEHRFGGRAPRRPRELTLIERFHRWKANSRTGMRNLVRRQFTSDTRASLRDWIAEREQKVVEHKTAPATEYAGVPLLNPQQVALVWQQNIPRGNRWDTQTVPVNVSAKGLYLVEATNGALQAYTIVSVTDIAVIAKGAPGRIFTRVAERASGAPVGNCPVIAWVTPGGAEGSPRGAKREMARAQTDAQGVAQVAVTDPRPESVLVLARRGEDFAAASVYGWNLSTDPERSFVGYVYTDRPVYRPGHAVHFRGVVRTQSASGYQLPAIKEVMTEVQDPEGKQILRRTLPVSSMGTVHGDFDLSGSAALGYYGVEIHAGEATMSGGFQVEEYKKPEYEVKVTTEKKRYLQGDSIRATIEARYYYGEPVANAQVKYVAHRSRYWPPWYIEDQEEQQAAGDDEDRYSEKEQVLEEAGTLDAQGKLTVRIPTTESKYDLVYRIEARVTDQANREISGAGWTLATVGSYLVRLEPQQYVYAPGEQARFNIETRDYDGNPVPQRSFTLEMTEHNWQKPDGPVIAGSAGITDAQGKAEVRLPTRTGSLLVRVKSKTPEGREVQGIAYVWVSGSGAWWGGTQQRVEIVPDKKSYSSGDKARILVITGVPEAHLWITAEGRTLHNTQMVHAKGPTVMVEIPIVADYAPNFFVTAVFLRDQKLYQGTKSIRVPPVERQIAVDLKPSKAQFRPGESGIYTIEAKDSGGRPVSAEFSLGVVDEAIYAIRKETVQDILAFFFGRGWNRVSTDSSLSYYFQGEAGKRRMQLARLRSSRPLAVIKPERLVEPKVRKAFPDTMFWSADVRTDARGRAQVAVNYPDALTTWRATARGVTADTKVGSAIERTIVRKNLILRLAVPRFFTEGDEVTVSAIVANYLANQKDVRVSLALQGLELVEGAARDITVASKGEGRLDFRVRARAIGNATLLGKALTDEESDALELAVPVLPFGVKLSEPKAGSLSDAQAQTELRLTFPQDSVQGSRRLEISVAPSIAGTVFGALEYLTTFPYGCTEQTMSSFVPNVIVSQAMQQLGLKSKVNPADLGKKIRAGLDRLYDFQHEDGGWGWWKTDDSQEFMTAYVVSGLKQAQAAGHPVRAEAIERAVAWLRGRWPQMKSDLTDLRAYVAYATGANLADVWNARASLSSYGLALLGLSLQQARDARAGEIATALEQAVKSDAAEAWWPMDRDPLMDIYSDSSAETTAYALKFLVKERPQSALLAKAALFLANHRDQGYYWSSTKQTAMVIFGLTDYLARSGELHPNFNVTVAVNGKQVLSTAPSFRCCFPPCWRSVSSAVQPGSSATRSPDPHASKPGVFRSCCSGCCWQQS
jgi:uncharacterized protein YfaS (alpha-2-macroglobulin family)